jgi:phosphoribosylglycinamide formyltransferase-1
MAPGDGKGAQEQFVSEAIEPTPGTFDAAAMSRGEPGLPREFAWRGTTYRVAELLSTWKTSTAERGEMYLRRHWFRLRTTGGEQMTLYCERQAKNAKRPKARWWLYTISG